MFAFIKSELYQHISIAVLLLTPQGLFNILDIYTAYIIRAHMYMYMTLYMYIYMYIYMYMYTDIAAFMLAHLQYVGRQGR